jgi:thiosulfate/3-mercaptopyruvate sulfurtransferase
MNLRFTLSLLSAAALSLAGLAAAATRPDMLVTSDWLSSHLKDRKLVILHVSANRKAYDAGHIPGARFMAVSDIAVTREGIHNELPPAETLKSLFEALGVSNDMRVIVYSDGSVLPATRAYFTLDYLGHGDHAALLDGGLEKWRSENRPLTTDVPTAAKTGHLTRHVKPELIVQMDEVRKMAAKPAPSKPGGILLDVRSAADFSGEKGAHIPNAVNLFWMDGQKSREDQTLKSEEDLRKFYESVGIRPSSKVVTYCNSGMQASQSYFTLKYLGYDVRMYDGSMSEWNLKNGPTEK